MCSTVFITSATGDRSPDVRGPRALTDVGHDGVVVVSEAERQRRRILGARDRVLHDAAERGEDDWDEELDERHERAAVADDEALDEDGVELLQA